MQNIDIRALHPFIGPQMTSGCDYDIQFASRRDKSFPLHVLTRVAPAVPLFLLLLLRLFACLDILRCCLGAIIEVWQMPGASTQESRDTIALVPRHWLKKGLQQFLSR